MARNIEMNYKDNAGGYEVLYPRTLTTDVLLTQITNNLFGYSNENVDTALIRLYLGGTKYGYAITLQFPDGSPAEGIAINGLQDVNGQSLVTNSNGFALGVSVESQVQISITSPYLDLQDITVTVESSEIITNKILQFESIPSYVLITNSGEYKLSPIVKTFDLCAVGGGGGTAGSKNSVGEEPVFGGGGGYVENLLNHPYTEKITVSIGSGGQNITVEQGGNGGNTTIKDSLQQTILTAQGGGGSSRNSPGIGNGNGGQTFRLNNGRDTPPINSFGGNGTIHVFNDDSLPLPGGGGGGGGKYNNRESSNGYMSNNGQQFGGRGFFRGAFSSTQKIGQGENGKVPGGGGGGGVGNSSHNITGSSSGGSGGIYFRAHYS